MGLYNTIQLQYKLPLPDNLGELTVAEIQSSSFQTKSLDSSMSFYKVDESGQLFHEKFEGEWREGDKKAKSAMGRIGHFERTKEWFESESYTGEINFYELFNCDSRQNDYWYEANAIFIGGKVSEVKLIQYKIENNAARKERDKIWKENLRKSFEFSNRWYIKYAYVPYSKLIRWLFRSYNQLLMKLPSQWQVEKLLAPWR